MAEIVVMVLLVGVFVKKVNQISLVHVEWGLVRLEFNPEHKKPERATKPAKPPKQINDI